MSESKARTSQYVYEVICGLSVEERAELMAMLEKDQDDRWASPEIKQAWLDECDRRTKLIDDGEVAPVPAEEVHRRIRKLVAK